MFKEVGFWLASLKMPVSEQYLRLRLESHPDYPSLTAVQDTLEELGIEANAYETTRDALLKHDKPFLVHLNIGGGVIYFFPDLLTAEKKIHDFGNQWSGVVMLAEKAVKYGNEEHDKMLKQEKQSRNYTSWLLSIFSAFLVAVAVFNGSWTGILFITNLAGLYFGWLITQKEFGLSNSVSDKICSMAKHSRCESVLFSKAAKLAGWLTWGDVGLVYFISSVICLVISLLQPTYISVQFYYLMSLAGALFPLYSIYYQWKVVKQWCMLCLAVVAVLVVNGAISLPIMQWPVLWNRELITAALLFTGVCAMCMTGWQLFKTVYTKSLTALENNIKALRLKRNPEIFDALMERQEVNPINLPQPGEAIRFGNPDAPYQIVMACNPYCGPCAKAHEAVEELYENFSSQLSVSIRFAIYSTDEDSIVTKAVKMILYKLKNGYHAQKIISEWYLNYSRGDYPANQKENVFDNKQFDTIITEYNGWVKSASIKKTPTLFINGREFDQYYGWNDILILLNYKLKDL